MSYARWSNSAWYAFYNASGHLSLWYSLDGVIDISYEDCLTMTVEKIETMYKCTKEEAEEAMGYVKSFIEDYNADQVDVKLEN